MNHQISTDQILAIMIDLNPEVMNPSPAKNRAASSTPSANGKKPAQKGKPKPSAKADDARLKAYGASALKTGLDKIRNEVLGNCNNTFNSEAFQLFQLVAGGVLDEATLESELITAGLACGLDEPGLMRTLASAKEKGMREPRDMPPDPKDGSGSGSGSKIPPSAATLPNNQGKQKITINDSNRDQEDLISESLKHIGARENRLYIRSGQLVMVIEKQSSADGGELKGERHRLEDVFRETMAIIADKHLALDKEIRIGGRVIGTGSVEKGSGDMMNFGTKLIKFFDKEKWIRELLEVISVPAFLPGGEIPFTKGYYPKHAILYDPGRDYAPIADNVTHDEAEQAAARIMDVVKDFPWADEPSKSTWLAFLLSMVARPAIRGSVPFFLIDASGPGSGKTLLTRIAHQIAFGVDADLNSLPDSKEERRKQLESSASNGCRTMIFDNISCAIGGDVLEMYVTSPRVSFRKLGFHKNSTVPVRMVFAGTGNNSAILDDMKRRTLKARLVSKEENPELRSNFSIRKIDSYALAHHEELLRDALAIVRAYWLAGKPSHGRKPFGSFADWDDLIRGAILWLGMADPCEDRPNSDTSWTGESRGYWIDFLRSVRDIMPEDKPIRISELLKTLREASDSPFDDGFSRKAGIAKQSLCDIIEQNEFKKITAKMLSKTLSRKMSQNIGGFMIDNRKAHNNTAVWFVKQVGPQSEEELADDIIDIMEN